MIGRSEATGARRQRTVERGKWTSTPGTRYWPQILPNILQDSSFSNQITFILHIQGVFSLPGRGFHQRVTLISSVPMTFDDVIVHVRQFIIALVFNEINVTR